MTCSGEFLFVYLFERNVDLFGGGGVGVCVCVWVRDPAHFVHVLVVAPLVICFASFRFPQTRSLGSHASRSHCRHGRICFGTRDVSREMKQLFVQRSNNKDRWDNGWPCSYLKDKPVAWISAVVQFRKMQRTELKGLAPPTFVVVVHLLFRGLSGPDSHFICGPPE